MNKKILNVELYIWLLFIATSLFFVFFSQADIFISNLFFYEDKFPMKGTLIESFFYFSIRPLFIIVIFSTTAVYLYNYLRKKNILNLNTKVFMYIILVISIAPGLIVTVTLKDNWERARPYQTLNYGGTKEFTPAFIPTNQNGRSFSSAHTAIAFSFVGVALLARRRNKLWMGLALSYAIGMAVSRVASGDHFVSDVITSFFIVFISTRILYMIILKDKSL